MPEHVLILNEEWGIRCELSTGKKRKCTVFGESGRYFEGRLHSAGLGTCAAWSRAGNVEFLNRYRRG